MLCINYISIKLGPTSCLFKKCQRQRKKQLRKRFLGQSPLSCQRHSGKDGHVVFFSSLLPAVLLTTQEVRLPPRLSSRSKDTARAQCHAGPLGIPGRGDITAALQGLMVLVLEMDT